MDGAIDTLLQEALSDGARLPALCDSLIPRMMYIPHADALAMHAALEAQAEELMGDDAVAPYVPILLASLEYRTARYEDAIACGKKALSTPGLAPTPLHVRVLHTIIGSAYRSLGFLEEALRHLDQGVADRPIGVVPHVRYYMGLGTYQIAEIYGELEAYEDMRLGHEKLIAHHAIEPHHDLYNRTLNGVGRACLGLGQYEEALHYLNKAQAAGEERGNQRFLARNLHDLGVAYATMQDYDQAMAYFQRAFTIRKEHCMTNAAITTVLRMSEVLIAQDKSDEAIVHLEEALGHARTLNVRNKEYETCRILSEAYAQRSQHEQALAYYQQFHALKEQLDDVSRTRAENQRMRELTTQLRRQKRLIEAQKGEIEESHAALAKLNANLEDLVAARTAALRKRNEQLRHYAFTNAHDVRGPLSTILGLLEIRESFTTSAEKNDFIDMIAASVEKLETVIVRVQGTLSEEDIVRDQDALKN